jgi:hypothetical protein
VYHRPSACSVILNVERQENVRHFNSNNSPGFTRAWIRRLYRQPRCNQKSERRRVQHALHGEKAPWIAVAMAMLTARSVQSLLDESCSFLTAKQVNDLATRLNDTNLALAAEWELIILSALSRVGSNQHEPEFPGPRKIDFRFEEPRTGLRLVGDITAVSDHLIQTNSTDYLAQAVWRYLEKRGISGGLSLGVDSEEAAHGNIKPKLPSPHEFKASIFDDPAFKTFVTSIRANPNASHTVRVLNDKAGVSIIYSPGRRTTSVSSASVRVPRDIEKNVLFSAVAGKASQINESGHVRSDGWRCVVVCDGDCAALTQQGGWDGFSRDQILREYFGRHQSIDLVVCVGIASDVNPFGIDTRRSLKFSVDVIAGRSFDLEESIAELFTGALQSLPPPVRQPANARHYVNRRCKKHFSPDGTRGVLFGGSTFTFSSRHVVDYLSGRIDRPRFETLTDDLALNVLRRELERGRLPVEVKLERRPSGDDDDLTIRLGGQDPAVSPYAGVENDGGEHT